MAEQGVALPVIGHSGITSRAVCQPAAGAAQQGLGEPPAVQEHEDLLVAVEVPLHGFDQRRREAVDKVLLTDVDQVDGR